MRNATYIFTIEDIDDPFLCSVLPIGITILAIFSGIPILAAACKFAGIVAKLEQVEIAVKEGYILFFQNLEMPFFCITPYYDLNIK